MASRDVIIKVKFDDNNAITSIEGLDKGLKGVKKTTEGVGASGGIGFGKLTASIFSAQVALQAFNKVLGFLGDSIDSVIQMQNAFLGLSSVARALAIDTELATNAAVRLSTDGLLSVAEASEGLKNLLGAGFGLPQATKLMLAFKDASAFNRQGMLGFGQAIVGATQGIKNQNSILVDNVGITKNLSIIMREAGFELQSLSDKVDGAAARQALLNGILGEAALFQGDAALAAETLQGKMSQLDTAIFNLQVAFGEGLAPALIIATDLMTKFINVLNPEKVNKFADSFERGVEALGNIEGIEAGRKATGGFLDNLTDSIMAFFGLGKVSDEFVKKVSDFNKKMGIAGTIIPEAFKSGTEAAKEMVTGVAEVTAEVEKMKRALGIRKIALPGVGIEDGVGQVFTPGSLRRPGEQEGIDIRFGGVKPPPEFAPLPDSSFIGGLPPGVEGALGIDKIGTAVDVALPKIGALEIAISNMSTSIGTFGEISTSAFQGFGDALQFSIQGAILGQQSLGAALRKSASQAIAAVAAKSIVRALFETAEGFAALARLDPGTAALHFKSAGMFAAIGGVAAGAAKGIAGGSGAAPERGSALNPTFTQQGPQILPLTSINPHQSQLTSTLSRIEGTLASFEIQGEGVVVRKGVEQAGGVLTLFDADASAGIAQQVHDFPEV